jgi:hypothetical protein
MPDSLITALQDPQDLLLPATGRRCGLCTAEGIENLDHANLLWKTSEGNPSRLGGPKKQATPHEPVDQLFQA